MPRFPSPGSSRAEFPGFNGTIKALRLPAALFDALRFLRAYNTTGSRNVSLPTTITRDRRRAWSWLPGGSGRESSVETTGTPKFLGNPNARLRMFFDPGRPMPFLTVTERSHGPR